MAMDVVHFTVCDHCLPLQRQLGYGHLLNSLPDLSTLQPSTVRMTAFMAASSSGSNHLQQRGKQVSLILLSEGIVSFLHDTCYLCTSQTMALCVIISVRTLGQDVCFIRHKRQTPLQHTCYNGHHDVKTFFLLPFCYRETLIMEPTSKSG